MTTFYTYAHYKPNGGELFYIGKGVGNRAYRMNGRNDYWKNIVNKYGKPDVKILAEWNTEKEALDHEVLLISCFRFLNYKLVNISAGGEMGTTGLSWTPWNKGKKTPLEVRLKQSAVAKGRKGNFKGRKHKPESIEKMKLNSFHSPLSEKGRQAIIDVVRGYKHKMKTCEHCGKTGGETGMARWHFDNCRNKGELN